MFRFQNLNLFACYFVIACNTPETDDSASVTDNTVAQPAVDSDTVVAPDETDAPTTDETDLLVDTQESAAQYYVFNDKLTAWCNTQTPCKNDWYDPNGPTEGMAVNIAAAGWHLAGPSDPYFSVLVDVRRDRDDDGSFESRGLVLATEPLTGELIDHPLLGDSFEQLGISSDSPQNTTASFMMIIDFESDGYSEVVINSSMGPVYRYNTASRLFEADARMSDAFPAEIRALPGPAQTVAWIVADIDSDGLLDVTSMNKHAVSQLPTYSPYGTLFQVGGGEWLYQGLHQLGGHTWDLADATGHAAAQTWESPGGRQFQVTAKDGITGCWVQRPSSQAGATNSFGYPLFDPCPADNATKYVFMKTPMGYQAAADMNRDGVYEMLISGAERTFTMVEAYSAFSPTVHFEDYGGIVNMPYPQACEPDLGLVVPDSDGFGWTCPRRPGRDNVGFPWGVVGTDINKDGWTDIVANSGDDQGSFESCGTGGSWCIWNTQVGVFENTGTTNQYLNEHRLMRPVPIEQINGNVPLVGNYNGMLSMNVDGDNDLDFLMTSTFNGYPAVFTNDTPTANRGFCLEAKGTVSNVWGVGSFIEVTTPDNVTQHFQVGTVGSENVNGQPQICIGTGEHDSATVVWQWPSGFVQTIKNVPAVADGEPGHYTIEEPPFMQILTLTENEQGARVLVPSVRRVPFATSQVFRFCSFEDELGFGEPARMSSRHEDWQIRVENFNGAISGPTVFTSPVSPTPSGCKDWHIKSARVGETRVTISRSGIDLPLRPRIWWKP